MSHSSTAENSPSSHNSLPNAPDQAPQPPHRAHPKVPPIHLYNTNTSKQALTLRLEGPAGIKDRNQPALRELLSALKRPRSRPAPQALRSRAARSQRPRGLPTRTKDEGGLPSKAGDARPQPRRLTPGCQAVDLQRQFLQDRHVLEGVVHGSGSVGRWRQQHLPARS